MQIGVLKKAAAGVVVLALLLLFTACSTGDVAPEPVPQGSAGISPGEQLPVSFIVENQTGFDIYELQLSAAGYDNWQPNLLAEVLAEGESTSVDFEPNAPSALWDLRVVDGGGFSVCYNRLDLLNCTQVSLQMSAGVPQAELS